MKVLLLFLSLITTSIVWAQQHQKFNPIVVYHGVNEGLPSNETYSVFKDSKGYIWVASDEGVARYNGYDYTTYTSKDGLLDNVVFDFVEDDKGRIWFVSHNSLLCFWENGTIKPYQHNDLIKKATNGKISNNKSLVVLDNGDIIFNLLNVGVISISDGKLELLPLEKNIYHEVVIKGHKFIHHEAERGVSEYESKVNIVRYLDQTNQSLPFISQVRGTQVVQSGQTNEHDIALINGRIIDLTSKTTLFESTGILKVYRNNDSFWICHMHGLLKANRIGDKFIIKDTVVKNQSVTNLYQDDEDNIWISTLNSGVGKLLVNEVLKSDLSENDQHIGAFIKFNEDFYFSTQQNLYSLTNDDVYNYADVLKADPNILPYSELIVPTKIGLVSNWGVMSLYTRVQFHKNASYFTFIWQNEIKTSDNQLITDIYHEDSISGYTWNNNSFYSFYKNKATLINLPNFNGTSPIIKGVAKDYNNRLYIFTSNVGLLILSPDLSRHYYLNEHTGGIENKLNGIKVLSNGLIVVYGSKGLSVFDPKNTNRILALTKNHFGMLPDINSIDEYNNELYIGSKFGLFKIEIKQLHDRLNHYTPSAKHYTYINNNLINDNSKLSTFPHGTELLEIEIDVLNYKKLFDKRYQFRVKDSKSWVDLERPKIELINPSGSFELEFRYELEDLTWSQPITVANIHIKSAWYKSLWFIILIFILTISVIVLLLKRRQLKEVEKLETENQLLELEQQMQRARLNPHFVFNVLNSIHSYMLHEEKDLAEKYLNRFSKLMREVLLQTKDGSTSIQLESSILDKYLELEQLRSNFEMEYRIVIDPSIGLENKIPSLMLQPFVENAVLYGENNSEDNPIEVSFNQLDNRLITVTISNNINGNNFQKIIEQMEKSSTTNAIGIIKKRLEKYVLLKKDERICLSIKIMEQRLIIQLTLPIID